MFSIRSSSLSGLAIIILSAQTTVSQPSISTPANQLNLKDAVGFASWCAQEKTLPLTTQKTIQAIIQGVKAENCTEAAQKIPRVFSLSIVNQGISDLSPLASLTNLRELILFDNNITDITPLAQMTNLRRLILGNNQISDLRPLTSLNNLERLYISNNNFTDLTPISSLTNLKALEELSLNSNQITNSNISPLWSLSNLNELFIHNNPVSRQFCPSNRDGLCFLDRNR